MSRSFAVALLAAGCTFVNTSDMRERTDGDGDGTPLTADCNDAPTNLESRSGQVSTMASAQALQDAGSGCAADLVCGETVTCLLDTERVLATSLCADPGNPNAVLSFGAHSRIHRFVAPAEGEVEVVLAGDDYQEILYVVDDEDVLPEIALMVNRGRTCELDACTLGYPLRVGVDEDDGGSNLVDGPREASAWFTADADEVFYVVASGPRANLAYTLQVRCP
jgi:hypothetical protein